MSLFNPCITCNSQEASLPCDNCGYHVYCSAECRAPHKDCQGSESTKRDKELVSECINNPGIISLTASTMYHWNDQYPTPHHMHCKILISDNYICSAEFRPGRLHPREGHLEISYEVYIKSAEPKPSHLIVLLYPADLCRKCHSKSPFSTEKKFTFAVIRQK